VVNRAVSPALFCVFGEFRSAFQPNQPVGLCVVDGAPHVAAGVAATARGKALEGSDWGCSILAPALGRRCGG